MTDPDCVPSLRTAARTCRRYLGLGAVVAVWSLFALPAWAQETAAPASGDVQDTTSVPKDAQPAPVVGPQDVAQDAQRQAADDAQLPAYLRHNASDANTLAWDPWERYNRRVFAFNKDADHVLKWVAQTYVRVSPEPVRDGVSRFFANLQGPTTVVNLVLQGHPGLACKSLGRFAVNSTVGIGGFFDPATAMHIPGYQEDFGLTLGHWGWHRSRYFLLPFAGPGTLRDRIGGVVDAPLGPYGYVEPLALRVGLIGASVVDLRAQLLDVEGLGAGVPVADEYVLVRETWAQHRMYQIDDQNGVTGPGPAATH